MVHFMGLAVRSLSPNPTTAEYAHCINSGKDSSIKTEISKLVKKNNIL